MQNPDLFYFQSKAAPGKVLDISQNPKNFGSLILFTHHGSLNQIFRIIQVSERQVKLQVQHSRKYLTVRNYNEADGTQILEEAQNEEPAQKFKLTQTANKGEYFIQTFANNKVLDIQGGYVSDETSIIQWPLHGQANQIWRLRKAT